MTHRGSERNETAFFDHSSDKYVVALLSSIALVAQFHKDSSPNSNITHTRRGAYPSLLWIALAQSRGV